MKTTKVWTMQNAYAKYRKKILKQFLDDQKLYSFSPKKAEMGQTTGSPNMGPTSVLILLLFQTSCKASVPEWTTKY